MEDIESWKFFVETCLVSCLDHLVGCINGVMEWAARAGWITADIKECRLSNILTSFRMYSVEIIIYAGKVDGDLFLSLDIWMFTIQLKVTTNK